MKTIILVIICSLTLSACGKKTGNDISKTGTDDSTKGNVKTERPHHKRATPKEVKPLVIGNIEYSAPTSEMGFIVASDVSSKNVLWKKQVYEVKIDTNLERDVQDVFIDSLWQDGVNIMIQNEDGGIFILNPTSKSVLKK